MPLCLLINHELWIRNKLTGIRNCINLACISIFHFTISHWKMLYRRRVSTPTCWILVIPIWPDNTHQWEMQLTSIVIFPSKILVFQMTIGFDLWQILCLFLFVKRTWIVRIHWIPVGRAPKGSSSCFSGRVSCWPRVTCVGRAPRRVIYCRIISWRTWRLAKIWAVLNMSAIICMIGSAFYRDIWTINTKSTDTFAVVGFTWKIYTCFSSNITIMKHLFQVFQEIFDQRQDQSNSMLSYNRIHRKDIHSGNSPYMGNT